MRDVKRVCYLQRSLLSGAPKTKESCLMRWMAQMHGQQRKIEKEKEAEEEKVIKKLEDTKPLAMEAIQSADWGKKKKKQEEKRRNMKQRTMKPNNKMVVNTLFAVSKQVNLGVFPHGPPAPPSPYSHDDQLLYSISHLSSCPGLSLFMSMILSLVFEGQKLFHVSEKSRIWQSLL